MSQAKIRSPAAGLALLPLHDSVEMLLQLVSERFNIDTRKANFLEYWTLLKGAELEVPRLTAMSRLNAARVALKHRGVLPSQPELEDAATACSTLTAELSQIVFGIDLYAISLIDLLPEGEIQKSLKEAEEAFFEGNYQAAITGAAVAFVLSLRSHRARSERFSAGGDLHSLQRAALGSYSRFDATDLATSFSGSSSHRARNAFSAIERSAKVFEEAILVLGYGLDLRSYLTFKAQMPVVLEIPGGGITVQWMKDASEDPELIRFCLNFSVDAALQLTR